MEDQTITFFFHAPHLIKSVRNCLADGKNLIIFNGNKVQWPDIVELYESERKTPIKSAHKLTDAHIYPNSFQKMTGRYATQVLSNTMAAGMNALYSSGLSQSQTAPNTIDVVIFFW